MIDKDNLLRPNEEKWDRWAEAFDGDSWRYRYLRRAQNRVISLLGAKEGISFLDFGCGTGWAIGQVADLVNNNGVFFGVDLSPKMIEKAKENFGERTNFFFKTANAELIPIESVSFDTVICTNSFHHYLDPDKALIEMTRVLKKGGRLYLLDPTADNWIIKAADRIIRIFEPAHVKIYSTKEFQRMFAGAGLRYIMTPTIGTFQKVHVGEKAN